MDLSEPGVVDDVADLKKQVTICTDRYEACEGADAVVVCTEWKEFKMMEEGGGKEGMDWRRVYEKMKKPAFVFDGRLILDVPRMEEIGFQIETIGRPGKGFRRSKDWE